MALSTAIVVIILLVSVFTGLILGYHFAIRRPASMLAKVNDHQNYLSQMIDTGASERQGNTRASMKESEPDPNLMPDNEALKEEPITVIRTQEVNIKEEVRAFNLNLKALPQLKSRNDSQRNTMLPSDRALLTQESSTSDIRGSNFGQREEEPNLVFYDKKLRQRKPSYLETQEAVYEGKDINAFIFAPNESSEEEDNKEDYYSEEVDEMQEQEKSLSNIDEIEGSIIASDEDKTPVHRRMNSSPHTRAKQTPTTVGCYKLQGNIDTQSIDPKSNISFQQKFEMSPTPIALKEQHKWGDRDAVPVIRHKH